MNPFLNPTPPSNAVHSHHRHHRDMNQIAQRFDSLVLSCTVSGNFDAAIDFFKNHSHELSSDKVQEAFKTATQWVEKDTEDSPYIRSIPFAISMVTYTPQKIRENPDLIQIAFQNSIKRLGEDLSQIEFISALFQKFHNILTTESIQTAFYNSIHTSHSHLWDSDYTEIMAAEKKFQREILISRPETLRKQNIQGAFKSATEIVLHHRTCTLKDTELAIQLLENCSDLLPVSLIEIAFQNATAQNSVKQQEKLTMRILEMCPEKLKNIESIKIAFLNEIENLNHGNTVCSMILNKCILQIDDQKFIQTAFKLACDCSKNLLIYSFIEQFSELLHPDEVRKKFEDIILSPRHNKKLIIQILENFPSHLFTTESINVLFAAMIRNTERIDEYEEVFHCLFNIEDYADQINQNYIITVYYNTNLPDVMADICNYVLGSGSWRSIRLSRRNSLLAGADHTQDQGIAFEIHRYSKDIDRIILFYIKELLSQNSIKKVSFSLNDLKKKVEELIQDPEECIKCLSALYKLRKDPEYANKLECILPYFAALLNVDSIEWGTHLKDCPADGRWSLWLKQFLLESGEAYLGDTSTSCIPGIYERSFSGFRTMLNAIDAIFLPSNIIRYYFPLSDGGFDPKIKLLSQKDTLKSLVLNLQTYLNERHNENSFAYLQSCCSSILYEHIDTEVKEILETDYYKEIPHYLKAKVLKISISRMQMIKRKLDSFVQNLEDIDLACGTDPNHPVSFTEMIYRIIYLTEKRFDPIPIDQAIDQEVKNIEDTIFENIKTIKFRNLIQKEIDLRSNIQFEENASFIDLTKE